MCKPKSSRLDLRNGFYQIRMAKQEIFKTSFSSPVGFFEWTVMPMGLINAPAYFFQRFMSDLLKDLRLVQVCIDEIVIHSATAAMHHEHLRQVFQGLQDNEFRLNLSKCSFQASSIDFFAFEISAAGVQPLTANVSSFMSLPSRLSSRTAVRRFLGMAKYYSHFVSHFSSIAVPLHRFTSNTTPFCWTPPCTSALTNIRDQRSIGATTSRWLAPFTVSQQNLFQARNKLSGDRQRMARRVRSALHNNAN